jgi:hypothetical protein
MADEAKPRGGGLRAVVLWLVIAALLGTVWWLASERNERHYRAAVQGQGLVIERGRFFPTGTAALPATDPVYGPIALPAGEKPPVEMEFDDQNALDRWLFDVLSGWAKAAAKKNETKAAAALVDRASQLPGLSGAQLTQLNLLRADLAWDDAQTDLANAAQLLDAARRKLEQVKRHDGSHAPEADALQGKLEGIQKSIQELSKR